MPLYKVDLLEVGVELELVDGGLDGCLIKELAQLVGREVGDSNVSDFAGAQELFHGKPGLRWSASAEPLSSSPIE